MFAEEHDKAAVADGTAYETDPPLPPYSRSHPVGVSGCLVVEESCNWLNVSRENESIRGIYTIDPHLDIPEVLLALPSNVESPLSKETEKMNLGLETKEEGDIDVIVRIVGGNGDVDVDGLSGSSADIKQQKVKIKMRSYKGSITSRIVPAEESNDLGKGVMRSRFIVYASADNGSVNISLPRSFEGSISAFAGLTPSPRGVIELSPDLRRNARILMDTDRKRYFVGDFMEFNKHSNWDAVSVGVRSGNVKVGYNDEVDLEVENTRKGWRRMICC